jgi:hypothetical protein
MLRKIRMVDCHGRGRVKEWITDNKPTFTANQILMSESALNECIGDYALKESDFRAMRCLQNADRRPQEYLPIRIEP